MKDEELLKHYFDLGLSYSEIWAFLAFAHGIYFRETVRLALKVMDPDGVTGRKKHRLKRRKYFSPGPNFLWHIDGYDKLKAYGFAIHGWIDGYSRRIMCKHYFGAPNSVKCHLALQS